MYHVVAPIFYNSGDQAAVTTYMLLAGILCCIALRCKFFVVVCGAQTAPKRSQVGPIN